MKASENCYQFIRKWEGCLLSARNDMVGVRTIGYGHTGKDVKSGMKITKAQAERFLKNDIEKMELYVNATMIRFNQNQFDSLVSFTFNLGPGCLNQLVKNRSKKQIGNAIRLYCHAGGVRVRGLVRRRAAETAIYFEDVKKEYFPECSEKFVSIVAALNSIGVDSSFNYREKIAGENISGEYLGTAKQNILMLNLLKKGKLVRP